MGFEPQRTRRTRSGVPPHSLSRGERMYKSNRLLILIASLSGSAARVTNLLTGGATFLSRSTNVRGRNAPPPGGIKYNLSKIDPLYRKAMIAWFQRAECCLLVK